MVWRYSRNSRGNLLASHVGAFSIASLQSLTASAMFPHRLASNALVIKIGAVADFSGTACNTIQRIFRNEYRHIR